MRLWMSAQAERARRGQRQQALGQVWPTRPALRCLLVFADEVALRTDVRSLVAPVRGRGDLIEAAFDGHVGPWQAGIVQCAWLDDPDLPVVRSKQGCTVGKPTLHPGPEIPRSPGRDEASPAMGNGITAGAGRDAVGGRARSRSSPPRPVGGTGQLVRQTIP